MRKKCGSKKTHDKTKRKNVNDEERILGAPDKKFDKDVC